MQKVNNVFLDKKEWHENFMNPKINGDLEGILLVRDEEKQLREVIYKWWIFFVVKEELYITVEVIMENGLLSDRQVLSAKE